MFRKLSLSLLPLVLSAAACFAAKPRPVEITDPEEAKADPDFAVQGEYAGDKIGVQVVARGGGKFDAVVYEGGLPGAGWTPAKGKGAPKDYWTLAGERQGDVVNLAGDEYSGTLAGPKLTLVGPKAGEKIELVRTVRQSPTLGAKPPAGAVVLYGGPTDADKWQRPKMARNPADRKKLAEEELAKGGRVWEPAEVGKDGALVAGAVSKPTFGDYRAHLEFRLSYMPTSRGQARSNSGVYFHNCYEIQVLDSFGLGGDKGECGAFYGNKAPDVNMCFPPLQWQTYDVDFTAPRYQGDTKAADGRMTVRHNGVVIHDNLALPKGTQGFLEPEGPGPRPIYLQAHGCHVHYQNIWVEEKK
jgi:hypothetical protein